MQTYRAYKWVDKRIKHISQPIPQEFKITQIIPFDPLLTLTPLDVHFGKNQPTTKFTQECIDKLMADMERQQFLWPKERDLFIHIYTNQE